MDQGNPIEFIVDSILHKWTVFQLVSDGHKMTLYLNCKDEGSYPIMERQNTLKIRSNYNILIGSKLANTNCFIGSVEELYIRKNAQWFWVV